MLRSIQTEFTLQLRKDISSTEILDKPYPSRPYYLHEPIILTGVKDFVKLVTSTLSRLPQGENNMDKVIIRILPVLRDFNIIRKCLMEGKNNNNFLHQLQAPVCLQIPETGLY